MNHHVFDFFLTHPLVPPSPRPPLDLRWPAPAIPLETSGSPSSYPCARRPSPATTTGPGMDFTDIWGWISGDFTMKIWGWLSGDFTMKIPQLPSCSLKTMAQLALGGQISSSPMMMRSTSPCYRWRCPKETHWHWMGLGIAGHFRASKGTIDLGKLGA